MEIEYFHGVDDISSFNQRLNDKTSRRVMQLLRLNGFREVKKSKVPQLTHLVDEQGNLAIRLDHNGAEKCIRFGGDYIFRDIQPWLDKSGTGLNGFIVQKKGLYYLYKVSSNFGENAQVELIENGGDNHGGFVSTEEVNQAISLLYGV